MINTIILTIFVALVVAVAITYFVNDFYSTHYQVAQGQNLFYSQNFDPNQKKIYLMGASQVGRLNATYIEEYISQTNTNFKIYNLAINADVPIKRIHWLQEIIDSKPVMVVYGITFRDLTGELPRIPGMNIKGAENQVRITDVIGADKPTSILPDPGEFFSKRMDEQTMIDFSNFDNSKENILKLSGLVTEQNNASKSRLASTDTPFIQYSEAMNRIVDESGMEVSYRYFYAKRIFAGYEEGKDIDDITLKKIVSTLKKNNIEVVLFSSPNPRLYLDKINSSDIEIFKSVLEEISDEFDVKVYHLYDKYADMNIWSDLRHVSMDKTAIIFNSDIAEIILDEIKS